MRTNPQPRPTEGAPPLLELRDVCMTFPAGGVLSRRRLRAVTGVSLSISKGETVALVGESGSGKSTIARIIARLHQPDSGRLLLDGADVLSTERRAASLSYRKRVQMIFQDPFGSLNPVHSVRYHLERPLLRHGRADRATVGAEVHALLETCGLRPAGDYADKHPQSLSGGQRQRVAIARALAPEPELLLADEPTSMLDVSIRMGVLNLLDRLRREQDLAMLLITHDLASARYLADRIAVLYAGEVVEEATAEAVIQGPKHPYTQLLLSAVPNADGRLAEHLADGAGGTPSPSDTTQGCAFRARCPAAFQRCHQERPALHTLRPTPGDAAQVPHRARCHLHAPAPA